MRTRTRDGRGFVSVAELVDALGVEPIALGLQIGKLVLPPQLHPAHRGRQSNARSVDTTSLTFAPYTTFNQQTPTDAEEGEP